MRSAATKTRWTQCQTIGNMLGVTKQDVNQYLFNEISDAGLMISLLEGDQNSLEAVKTLPGWSRMQEAEARTKEALQKSKNPQHGNKSSKYDEQDLENDPVAQMRLGMWFIAKFSSAEKALAVLQASVNAMKCLEAANKVKV